tara:strand:+ start:518 stop:691 length:174 start_codon:yes stop_codon:yes gene_type:complete
MEPGVILEVIMNKNFTRGNLDKQISTLPNEVKFCRKCVMSNQKPRIVFDEHEKCSIT